MLRTITKALYYICTSEIHSDPEVCKVKEELVTGSHYVTCNRLTTPICKEYSSVNSTVWRKLLKGAFNIRIIKISQMLCACMCV